MADEPTTSEVVEESFDTGPQVTAGNLLHAYLANYWRAIWTAVCLASAALVYSRQYRIQQKLKREQRAREVYDAQRREKYEQLQQLVAQNSKQAKDEGLLDDGNDQDAKEKRLKAVEDRAKRLGLGTSDDHQGFGFRGYTPGESFFPLAGHGGTGGFRSDRSRRGGGGS